MVTAHNTPHETELRGAWAPETAPGPVLLQRTEEDFVRALLADLDSADAAAAIARHRVRPPPDNSRLRLFQPVHRVFTLAVLEARCQTFGLPRLDPRKIESAGLVVRRIAETHGQPERDARGGYVLEGWRTLGPQVAGWVRFPAGGVTADCDPQAERRCGPRLTGHAGLDRQLWPAATEYSEAVASLFPVPPDLAARCGRTLLFGVVPVTSTARAGQAAPQPPAPADAAAWEAAWQEHLPPGLKAGPRRPLSWPAGTLAPFNADNAAIFQATDFFKLVQQLGQEFGAFQEDSPEAAALRRELDRLAVELADGSTRPAGQYLKAAARVLLEGETASPALPAPRAWPAVSAETAAALDRALKAAVEAARKALLAAPGRFDEPGRLYVARAFIRVRQPGGCPPKLVWSAPGEPFEIAPWHAAGPVAPAPIQLPELSREHLRRLKPGVMFSVPRDVFNLLRGRPEDLLQGKGRPAGLQLDWLCGFNIPIITLCAFILLSLLLTILNLIFWWLPFVKICIPFPRKR
jgi:hypothetical protein